MIDDRTSFSGSAGAINTFKMKREWWLGRLIYWYDREDLFPSKTLRIASQSDVGPCWPWCRCPRVCARRDVCDREQARATCVWRARDALARGLV